MKLKISPFLIFGLLLPIWLAPLVVPNPQISAVSFAQTQTPGPDLKSNQNTAQMRFSLKLFSAIQKKQDQKNIFISPLSVGLALQMLSNGAKGETQQAINQVLETSEIDPQQLNWINEKLLYQLRFQTDPKIQLSIANSLWLKKGAQFNPEFLQISENVYKTENTALDFNSPNAPTTINQWVDRSTRGKIKKIVDQVNSSDLLFLINAVYFKGDWSQQFDPKLTRPQLFTLLNGSRKQHPLMSQSGRFQYAENDLFQAISLPYGQRQFSMVVFLPKPGKSLSNLYQQLNADNWEQWMSQLELSQGSISLPRFKMDYDLDLQDPLQALGMGIAFGSKADFSGITTEPVSISEAKHKTFVEVNEKGTEAAAATSIGVGRTSVEVQGQPFKMVVDRPFFCVIRDTQTKAILFMGSIVDPQL